MGNVQHVNRLNYEDIKWIINNANNTNNTNTYILINTLPPSNQSCVILTTIPYDQEEQVINNIISTNINTNIVVYGKNCNDQSVYDKCKQLSTLGCCNISVYVGGMFEWLLMQDIYGTSEFQTNTIELDIIKYTSARTIIG